MDENVRKELEEWVRFYYKQHTTGWTYMRSEGNFADCFNDGYDCGMSWAAYEIGRLLGMELEDPNIEEENED